MAVKKKTRGKASEKAAGSKKDFILSFSPDTPAADVVAAGKQKGLVFSAAYVYVLRSKAGRSSTRGAARAAGARGGRARGAQSGGETAFIELALELGLGRAADLLAKVRARARELSR